ncbi:MAG: hypothetical protein WCW40_08350 [Bacteroidota bacterium]
MATPASKFIFPILLILAVTTVSFIPAFTNGWTSWDDDVYVTDNPAVQNISAENLKLVFTTAVNGSYLPLTMISYMIDYQIGGFDPRVYHSTNILLHLINSCLLFWLMYQLSGSIVASLVAGLLFGIHPMRVESVAWISGRKDVLSMMFFLLSSIAYLRYVRVGRQSLLSVSFILFFFALLSKIIVLTFPLILLLFDMVKKRNVTAGILWEKVPFALIATAFSVLGLIGQQSVHAVKRSNSVIENGIVSLHGIVFYIEKLFLPINLSNVYPYPSPLPLQFFVYTIIALIAILVVWKYREQRIIAFGMAFYIVSLLPVLQFVRFSQIFAADRFTYFAYIGLFYIAGMYSAKGWELGKKRIIIPIMVIVLVACSYLTWERCEVWKDSNTLWKDMLSKYPNALSENSFQNRHDLFPVQPVQQSRNKGKGMWRASGNEQIDRMIVDKLTV